MYMHVQKFNLDFHKKKKFNLDDKIPPIKKI